MPFTDETNGHCDRFYKGWHSKPEAVVGWPHFGSWSHDTVGLAWSITTGHVEFVELMQFGHYRTSEYHEYLNLGFRITAAAGSDFGWGSTIGETRVYVYTGTPLDIDRWFAHLKKGHCFATSGPALEFTVDGELPGSEVRKKSGGTIKVVAKVLGHPGVAVPERFTVEGAYGVIREVENEENVSELSLEFDLPVEKSQWIAAHTICTNGAAAHTTPVFVVVDGKPCWNLEKGPRLCDDRIRKIRAELRALGEREDRWSRGIVRRLDKAIEFYTGLKKRIEEAGGD